MITANKNKGTEVHLAFVPDCGSNVGGWFVEIYLEEYRARYDDFCIHPEDCNCQDWDEVEAYAREYVSTIKDY